MNEPAKVTRRWSIDWLSALMATLTVAALLGAAWFRSGSVNPKRSLAVGDHAPLLQFEDLDSSEPILLAGLKGKVVWIVFWSAEAPEAPSTLGAIARASNRLRTHRRFSLVTAAAATSDRARVRAALAESGFDLPVYLASPATLGRFTAEKADPPLHALIDADGQIIAISRGAGQATIDRLVELATHQLEELDPMGNTRFAFRPDSLRLYPGLLDFANANRHELVQERVRTKRRSQIELHPRMPAAELVARGRQVALEMHSG